MNPYRDELTSLSSSGDVFTIRHLTTENYNEMVQLAINKLHVLEESIKKGELVYNPKNFCGRFNRVEVMAVMWDMVTKFIKMNDTNPSKEELSEIWKLNILEKIDLEKQALLASFEFEEGDDTVSQLSDGVYICKKCGKLFILTDNDKDKYTKKAFTFPKHCPECIRLNREAKKLKEGSK